MNNVKSYASSITKNYTSALERLKKKYEASRSMIDAEYDARNQKIIRDGQNSKNELSANYKMSLENANNALAEKGIASSGTAVNTEISSNLSKSRALSDLQAKTEEALSESFADRMAKISALETEHEKGEREVNQNMIDDLISQEKLDREYEYKKAQSDEDTRRWEKEYEQKKLDSDRDYELQQKKLSESLEDSAFDRALAQKKYELDAYKAYKEESEASDSSSSKSGSSSKGGSSSKASNTSDDGNIPAYESAVLVRAMYTAFMRKEYKSEKKRMNDLKAAIQQVLLDTSIAPSFKRDVRVYASAMGYI